MGRRLPQRFVGILRKNTDKKTNNMDKHKFFKEASKFKSDNYYFNKLTQLESKLSALYSLGDQADSLVENIEEATNNWENKIYEAKEYYNSEIRDQLESIQQTFDELGVSLEGTSYEYIKSQSEELNEKFSSVLGKDLFAITRELKNQFS